MKRLTAIDVNAQKMTDLGLDPGALDLNSQEAIAAAIRRAAGFLCPCSAATLVRSIVRPLRGLVPDMEVAKEMTEETLEASIAHGDIVELQDIAESGHTEPRILLYAAPFGFVARQSGTVILIGVPADYGSVFPEDLNGRIEYAGHVRRIRPTTGEDLGSELRQFGLTELSYESWLKAPPAESPESYLASANRALDGVPASREIAGLQILDPERPVRYYRGRWIQPGSQSGRYIGRRSQAFGADLWCYVELRDGNSERMIDLPHSGYRWRGCDAAWRLQLAIDAMRGNRQLFRVRGGPRGYALLEFFSPVPAWARRKWDAVGEPVASSGCLFSYRFPPEELEEERRFVCNILWMAELK